MPIRSRLRSFWRNLVHRDAVERDLDEELKSFATLVADEQRQQGRAAPDAARAGRLALGGIEQVKEGVRAARAGASLETLWRDVIYGIRTLRRAPAFSAAAIATLALGVGATSAVFGLLNAVRLRELPVPHAEQLAEIRLDGPRCCRHTGRNRQVSLPLFREIVQNQQAFDRLFAFNDTRINLAPHGEVRYVEALFVSGEFFPVLGVPAAIGRTLTPNDDQQGCTNPGTVISHALWQNEFGGRPDVLSQKIRQYPIVGVMPASFFGVEVGRRFEMALPLCASGFNRPDHWWLAVMGRLKPGWTSSEASAHLSGLGPSLLGAVVPPNYEAEQARQFVALKLSVQDASTGVSPLRTQYADALWLLMAIAGLVLVTACANVGGLSLVRTTTREPEIALTFALGASRLRVVRQLLVEGTLVAVAGLTLGFVVARVAHRGVLTLLSTPTDPIVLDTSFDWRTLWLAMAMAGVTTLAFALAPAMRAAKGSSLAALGTRSTDGPRRAAARELLVGVQVAMSVVLVSAALLFVFSSWNLLNARTGFNARNLFVANVFLPAESYPVNGRAAAHRELTARLASIPGIEGAVQSSTPPLGGSFWGTVASARGASGEVKAEVIRNQIGAGYFSILQIPLLAGRDFSDADTPSTPKVAIVNEAFGRQLFGEARPLGRRFADGGDEFEVVGIVSDSKHYTLREDARSIAYTAASQALEPPLTVRFLLRSQISVPQAIAGVRTALADVAPTAGVRFATVDDLVAAAAQRERLMARLAGFFGVIALALAAIGVYGVVAYSAASRRREIGIRLALGARARHIVRSVVGRLSLVAATGCAAGLALTVATSSLAASLLYGVQLQDPRIIALILATIAGSGVAAAAIPARRALKTDPVRALKEM